MTKAIFDSAALRLTPLDKKVGRSLCGDLEAAVEAMKNVTWTALEELKGDRDILKKIADAVALLQSLRKALSQRKHVADQEQRYGPGAPRW